MRTIEVTLFKFDELSGEAKQNAISDYRSEGIDTQWFYDEAYETVKEFHKIFQTSEGSRSWLDVRVNYDDQITDLTGIRLRTWIINNYGSYLFTPKYLGHVKGVARYSRVQKSFDCPLTGVCYDHLVLQPIEEFLKKPDNRNIEDLINEGFEKLRIALEKEEEYYNSDEAITEAIQYNEYEFTSDGKRE